MYFQNSNNDDKELSNRSFIENPNFNYKTKSKKVSQKYEYRNEEMSNIRENNNKDTSTQKLVKQPTKESGIFQRLLTKLNFF